MQHHADVQAQRKHGGDKPSARDTTHARNVITPQGENMAEKPTNDVPPSTGKMPPVM